MRFHFGVGAVFSSFAESKVNVRKITFTRNNCFVTPMNRCAKLSPSSGTALIQAKPKMGGLISGSALAVVLMKAKYKITVRINLYLVNQSSFME